MDTVAEGLTRGTEGTQGDGEDLVTVEKDEMANRARKGGKTIVPDHASRGGESGKEREEIALEDEGKVRTFLKPLGDDAIAVAAETIGIKALRPGETEKRGSRAAFGVVGTCEKGARNGSRSGGGVAEDGGKENREATWAPPDTGAACWVENVLLLKDTAIGGQPDVRGLTRVEKKLLPHKERAHRVTKGEGERRLRGRREFLAAELEKERTNGFGGHGAGDAPPRCCSATACARRRIRRTWSWRLRTLKACRASRRLKACDARITSS